MALRQILRHGFCAFTLEQWNLANLPHNDEVWPLGNAELHYLALGVLAVIPREIKQKQVLVLSVGVHGNETAPIEWLDTLISRIITEHCICQMPVLLLLANPAATAAGQRFCQYNLNRLFTVSQCHLPSFEARRARQLQCLVQHFSEQYVGWPCYHLDLHCAIKPSLYQNFAVHPQGSISQAQANDLAKFLSMQALIINPLQGNSFTAFTARHLGCLSFTCELGQAKPFGTNNLNDLASFDDAIVHWLNGDEQQAVKESEMSTYRVEHEIIKQSFDFRFCFDLSQPNFTPLETGAPVYQQQGQRIFAQHANSTVVFANDSVEIGQRAGLLISRATDPL